MLRKGDARAWRTMTRARRTSARGTRATDARDASDARARRRVATPTARARRRARPREGKPPDRPETTLEERALGSSDFPPWPSGGARVGARRVPVFFGFLARRSSSIVRQPMKSRRWTETELRDSEIHPRVEVRLGDPSPGDGRHSRVSAARERSRVRLQDQARWSRRGARPRRPSRSRGRASRPRRRARRAGRRRRRRTREGIRPRARSASARAAPSSRARGRPERSLGVVTSPPSPPTAPWATLAPPVPPFSSPSPRCLRRSWRRSS